MADQGAGRKFWITLAGSAAAVAFHLRPEKEAVIHLTSRTRRRLRQIYWLKATALTRQSINESNDTSARLGHLKAAYQDAKAQIFDRKDENTSSKTDRPSHLRRSSRKGRAIQSGIDELDSQLQKIIAAFRDHHEYRVL